MHLRSITLKGFKSFPDRTKLDFAPGVSVIVGPNGSGKSNITDAVLWALGEQSPLAVRGQTMQDVIFAGAAGVPSRNAAEVEVLLDNSDGSLESGFSEVSIARKLSRDGEGEYRLNGARCRMVDVLEVLSDTGLGKEMHSVVSQGRVESIIHSKPRDRRLLIEEAAGLGKHRKRRRRAQLKLERTQDNLARALDVEREARSRLRPLKRQAEAAELHQRLERQSLEARLELAADDLRAVRADLAEAEEAAAAARGGRDEAEQLLAQVAERREQAEEAFAEHSRARERLSSSLFAARAAADGIALRADRAREAAQAAADDAVRDEREATELEGGDPEQSDAGAAERIAALETQLRALDSERDARLEQELAELEQERVQAEATRAEAEAAVEQRRAAVVEAERAVEEARHAQRDAERAEESARAAAAKAGSELAALNQFLRTNAAPDGARTLAAELKVDQGFELAVAAVLGPRLRAGLVGDLDEGNSLLDRLRDGGSAILSARGAATARTTSPGAGAERILDHVNPPADLAPVAERLLADAWLVEDLAGVPRDFAGIAVTPRGRALFGATGELLQAPAGGEERVLEARAAQEELVAASQKAASDEGAAREAAAQAAESLRERLETRERANAEAREASRALDEADELLRRATRRIELRRASPEEGQAAVRRARMEADLAAERRMAERAEHDRAERRLRLARLRARVQRCQALAERATRAAAVLGQAAEAVAARRDALAEQLAADEAVGARTAAQLRACAREEVEIQSRLKQASESVTRAEVHAQQARDAEHESKARLDEVAGKLELPAEPAPEPLAGERREELAVRIDRLARRREQLGPVNPLAEQEYEEAIAHVEELETQRGDLESALHELEGLIKETDRRIREAFEETFEQAARNFEEVVQQLFPGGRGRLRLVRPEGPKPVIGGEDAPTEEQQSDAADEAAEAEEEAPDQEEPGVEVEVTPAGKSMKKLSLLSGGEKSLVALAFMFAVFLARPCPFYILDEVEAALDDLNIDRFLKLIHQYSDRAQFIIVTHQKRTMDAADVLYGVSMGGNGISKVVSRRLPEREQPLEAVPDAGEAAA